MAHSSRQWVSSQRSPMSEDTSGGTEMVRNNMSRYMRSKMSKSQTQVVEGESDYTAAMPAMPPPRPPTRPPTRALLDEESDSSLTGKTSSTSKQRYQPYLERRQSREDVRSCYSGSRDGSLSRFSASRSLARQRSGGSRDCGSVGNESGIRRIPSSPSAMTGVTSYSTVTGISGVTGATGLATGVSVVTGATAVSEGSEMGLPLPYSRIPMVKPLCGREDEMEVLLERFNVGAGLTSIRGVGGIGKTHLAIHASRKWLADSPHKRFVVWLNAATEWTLRISYLEALHQVLMGNLREDYDHGDSKEKAERGEVIIVADLLHRQLQRQRRKQEAKAERQERKRRNRELQNIKSDDEDDEKTTQVFSEDSEDIFDEEEDSEEYLDEDEELGQMDTQTLAHLLWDALLQGVSQEYEWLVVVQNVPGGMAGEQGPGGLKKLFFPTNETPEEDWKQGRIVLTTRHNSFAGVTCLGPIHSLLVERLDEAAAVRMLVSAAAFDASTEIGQENLASPSKLQILRDSERIAKKLVGPHYLDGSPLMISTAVGQIVSSGRTIREYYSHLKHQVAMALEASGYGNGKVQSSVKRETAMSVCLEEAMDNAHAQDLADIVSAAAFVCGEEIPLKILGGDPQRIRRLCDMNLLNQVGPDTYSMHRVHQRTAVDAIVTNVGGGEDYARGEGEEFLCTPDQAVLALRSIMADFVPENASTWRATRCCIPHVEALRIHHDLLERKGQLSPNFNHTYYAEIIHASASALQWAMKDRKGAFNGFKEALRLQRRLLHFAPSPEIFSTSSSSNVKADLVMDIAQTLSSLGALAEKPEEAHAFYKEALDVFCLTFGDNSKSVELMSLYVTLADVENKLRRAQEAYDHYKKGLELYFTIFGHNQNAYADDQKLFLAGVLQKIGCLAHEQMQRHAEAELYLEGTVSLLNHLLHCEADARRAELAVVHEALGSTCHAQGRVKDARVHYNKALKIKNKIHGGKQKIGISKKSRVGGRDISRNSISESGDDSSTSENSGTEEIEEGVLLQRPTADTDDCALEIIQVDSDTRKRNSASKDAKLAKTLHRLGVMAWNLGSLKQAEDYFEKALAMQYKAFGSEAQNEDIAITLFSLGGLSNDLHNNQEKACAYYKKALEGYYASLGRDAKSESIAQLLHALGQSLQLLKRPLEARKHLIKALDMKILLYGGMDSNNPELVAAQLDLGKVSRDLDANDDAMFYYKAALKGLYTIYGRDAKNSQLAVCLTQLGGLSYCSGRLKEAKDYFEKCLEMKLYLYGHDEFNDDIASTLNNLGSLNAKMKDYEEAFRYYEQALLQYTRISANLGEDANDEEIKNHRARTLHNLGLLSYNLKRFDDAKKFLSESTRIKSEVFKDVDDSPDLALTLSKLASVESRQGNIEIAKYYQDQAIKRSHTFLETHKSLINKDLLPPTVEEAAALLIASPNEDDSDARRMLKDLEFWQARVDSGEATKSCFLKLPFKVKLRRPKKGGKLGQK